MQVKVHSEWMLIVWRWVGCICTVSPQGFLLSVGACECCQSLLLPASSALYCCRCERSLYHTITSLIPSTLLSDCLYLSLSLSRRALVVNSVATEEATVWQFRNVSPKLNILFCLFFSQMEWSWMSGRNRRRREGREAKYLGKTTQGRQWDSTTCCLGSR